MFVVLHMNAERERKPVWVELLQGFLVGTRIRVSECFVSVAIMWIIIDNCKIYTHESKANMQTSRLVVMPRIGSVEWLVSVEIYEGTVSKKYFTQIVKQRERVAHTLVHTEIECLCCS